MNIFIIGNGFDIAHGLPTKYSHFHDYLLSRYPSAARYDGRLPESIIDNHGEERFNIEELVGYITRIINEYAADDWADLELCLGDDVFDSFISDLDIVDMDASDKETMMAIHRNESLSSDIRKAFSRLKTLFCEWVNCSLSNFKYDSIQKSDIAEVLADGNAFLSFNYTMTLEKAYGVSNVCHIHGMVGESENEIFFGHGDDDEYHESLASFGADTNLNFLKRELRKDTQRAMARHRKFFDSIKNVKTIHSFGFSFAEVDMTYIEAIAQKASGAVWYLNKHDDNNADIREKLTRLGFTVIVDKRW